MLSGNRVMLFIASIGLIALLGLSGCARYSARPLKAIPFKGANKKDNTQCITLSYRIFDTIDCKRYLGRNVKAKGYQPIQITLRNKTHHPFSVSPNDFSLVHKDPKVVARAVHSSTMGRVAGYSAISLWGPLSLWTLCSTTGEFGVVATMILGGPILIVALFTGLHPAIVNGINSVEDNALLDKNFNNKALRTEIVLPYSTTSGLIFVPCKYFDQNFTLTVQDLTTQEKFVLSPTHCCISIPN